MIIEDMDLRRFGDGQYTRLYYEKAYRIPAGIGTKSNAVRVVLRDSLKVHISNCKLYESLDSVAKIEADTAHWQEVSDGIIAIFALSTGASYLYAENTSGSTEAVFNVTGV